MSHDLKQDFETARVKHMLFKSKLRSFLYGLNTDEKPIRDPDVCALGQWIKERALKDYAALPESRELDQLHQKLHHRAGQLMDMQQAGQQEQAIQGLTDIEKLAAQLVKILEVMEQKLQQGR